MTFGRPKGPVCSAETLDWPEGVVVANCYDPLIFFDRKYLVLVPNSIMLTSVSPEIHSPARSNGVRSSDQFRE